ncbi:hypothetical protein H4R21_002943 [Coemansia helicoidea]|uniref:Uncharacterized protein n=1 Tax=Coemansia helicoidea TaxID=1286919 RepID=A0ACC1L5K9_9FUNG|nr:hypothetical protein H4R21_002943 [Coemansia helicoidea]
MAAFSSSSHCSGVPSYILERGDSAREYRRRSSCISRTSDSSAAGVDLPGMRHFPYDRRASIDRDAPGDLESYLIAEVARTSGAGDAALDKQPAGRAPSLAPGDAVPERRGFGLARPKLIHVQK